ncbi:peroxiredoxin Q [Sanghuangporus baumii]|uniref:thioredoxin-dependent peroxiredoxin n=1 Tax=Sanghuangporus baumii TaxID=108892 RepID=A0A9Q5I1Y5_SANBA|nr:peroxiredoxin Q [Sanghuangporus baumii]
MGKHELIGKKAPELSLPNHGGDMFAFTPGGRPVVIFFYPASGSYGCTKEACSFRDALSGEEVFKSTQVEIIGISPDPVEKQKSFVDKHGLTYPILSDAKGEARKAYSVGKALLGLAQSSRVTFVIDSEGIVKYESLHLRFYPSSADTLLPTRDVYDSTLHFSAHKKFVEDWLKTIQPKEPSATTSAPEPAPAPAEQSSN